MEEFATVAEAAETGCFVVFADVRGEVRDGYCADVCVGGCSDGTNDSGGGGEFVGVLLEEVVVGGFAFVCCG